MDIEAFAKVVVIAALIYLGRYLARRVIAWAIRFFAVFVIACGTASAQSDPPPTEAESLQKLAEQGDAVLVACGILTGLIGWQLMVNRTRIDY